MIDLTLITRAMEREIDNTRLIEAPYCTEGTYAPTYTGSVTAGTTTYTTQVGFYTRVGRVVVATGRVVWTAATGTGAALISLPFTSVNTTDMRYAASLRSNGLTFANGNVVIQLTPGNSVFQMDSLLTNAAPTAVAVEAAGDVIFTVVYFAA